MILVGNQRGGARDLSRHLMKDENERVVVHEVRGFASDNLQDALQESEAISRGTRCRQHLFSLSLNPPKNEEVGAQTFEDAVVRVEKTLGLTDQPRAIVFHEKIGADGAVRRHAHAVWCRIDTENMRAIHLPFTKHKLQDLARDLYREHGWKMPRGFTRHEERNPTSYSLAEWQQAKRAGRDPQKLKSIIQDSWLISDCKMSFANALKENGFILAKGDKRGAVAVDHTGEAFSVSRAVNIKAKQVRDRVGDLADMPGVDEAHRMAAKIITDRLEELRREQQRIQRENLKRLDSERTIRLEQESRAAEELRQQQAIRRRAEKEARNARIRKGLRGLLDRVTGKRKRVEAENCAAVAASVQRDAEELQARDASQSSTERALEGKAEAIRSQHAANIKFLSDGIRQLDPGDKPVPSKARDKDEDKRREEFIQKRKREAERPKRRRRSRGPSPRF